MSQTDLCSTLNLTNIEKIICKSLESTPLTANLLYKLFLYIQPKLPLLTINFQSLFKNNIIKIVFFNAVLQHLSSFIFFSILLIILLVTKTIKLNTFLGLIFISLFLANLFTN